jgi:hypothetical protein
MRKSWYLAAAPVAAAMAILASTPAFADNNVITVGSAGGPAAQVGDVATASLAAGTTADFNNAADSSTGAHCSTSQLTARITSNPAAPGTATESLTGQTFSNCTANVSGVRSVRSVVVENLAFVTSVSSDGTVVVAPSSSSAPIQTTVQLSTLLGTITCRYRSTDAGGIRGVTSNADNSITLTDQSFTKFSGPSLCFNTAFLTAKYGPVTINGQPTFTN